MQDYKSYSASLRILGAGHLHEEIEGHTGLRPTRSMLKGEIINKSTGRVSKIDNWILKSALGEEEPLSEHVQQIIDNMYAHKSYFKRLVDSGIEIDLFCGYRSNNDQGGVTIRPDQLKFFGELGIPFGLSILHIAEV